MFCKHSIGQSKDGKLFVYRRFFEGFSFTGWETSFIRFFVNICSALISKLVSASRNSHYFSSYIL